MTKVKELKEGMNVVSRYGTEFEVVGHKGRKYVQLKRLHDGRVWFYDNAGLELEGAEVVK